MVSLPECPHRVDHPADPGIEDLHHLAIDARAAALHDFRRVHLALPRRRLDRGGRPRPVRCVVVQAEEIGAGRRGGSFDIGKGPLAQQVGDIACPLDRQFAFPKVGLAALALMRVVAREAAHDAEEFVVAALQRAVFRQKPEVPFADQCGAIAGRAQQRRQCREAGRDAHLRLVAVGAAQRLDEADLEAVLVAPGDQPDPRVGAERRVGVGLSEAHPLAGEPVERRCAVAGLPGAAEIRIAAVVDHDKDYIRANRAGHGWLLVHGPNFVRKPDAGQARDGEAERWPWCLRAKCWSIPRRRGDIGGSGIGTRVACMR